MDISSRFSPADLKNPVSGPSTRGRLPVLSLIVVVSLCLRIWNVFEFKSNDPMFQGSLPMLDMFQFQRWMVNIVDSGWLDRENTPFWQAPLYAYTMALVIQLFGKDMLWVKLFQAILGSATCILVYLVGRKAFSERVGLLAALLACFYGMFILYEAVLLRESFLALVFLLSILTLLMAREREGRRWYFFAGMCLGLCVLGRENLLLFVPVALIWTWVFFKESSVKARAARAGLVLAGFLLTIAPVTAKNYLVGNEFVLVSKGAGYNFYMANCRDGNGTVCITPSMLRIAPNLHHMSPQELASIDWLGLTMREIREDPARFGRLLSRKFSMYWGSYEIPNNINYYLAKRFSRVLRLPLIPYWLILPFAVSGFILSLRKWPAPAPLLLLALLLTYMASILLVCIVARYRVPMVPYHLMFAAFTLDWWYRNIRAREYRKLGLSLIPFLLVGAFSLSTRADYIRPNDYYNVALAYQNNGNYPAAAADYINALRADPLFSPARRNLVVCYLSLNRLDEAAQVAYEGIEREPDNPENYQDMAMALQEMGRIGEAARNLEHALVLEPGDWAARKKLAALYQMQGRAAAAQAELDKAIVGVQTSNEK